MMRGQRAVLVGMQGCLLGIVSITDLKRVRAVGVADNACCGDHDGHGATERGCQGRSRRCLKVLANNGLNQAPVVENSRVLGMLNRADRVAISTVSRPARRESGSLLNARDHDSGRPLFVASGEGPLDVQPVKLESDLLQHGLIARTGPLDHAQQLKCVSQPT
jgi:hypothetical protein